ncbi:hypothetical protein NOJ28_21400 [Neorhizobium galegae]|uniref:hypothetical protein n=1 Tax=Neorhizobium galegae TaxID=399 RepID=UPI00062290C5|nr:hypothetical protein [Neorhizobium galegae]KAB1110896.1 hypothetical protein F4V89_22370 [Neorhizobium galegae]MCQ1768101.1 hypothetical protein [Neorhizobium galegae]MCQ1847073.1 hypothetical protein [Neorhizobium galegae]CDZ29992.1 Hypothetical protein NGAL_HAMBI490_48600 [Neorhizobium galegae bv. officinalis]
MHQFLETTFGPDELEIPDIVLEEWRARRGLPKDNPDVELAAAVMLNLFREGNRTIETLKAAAAEHRALSEL